MHVICHGLFGLIMECRLLNDAHRTQEQKHFLFVLLCRSEIEALNNKLFESGAASIAGLKANLARATAVLAATGDGREEVSRLLLLLMALGVRPDWHEHLVTRSLHTSICSHCSSRAALAALWEAQGPFLT